MYTIHLVPLSHYDVAWAFNKEDYLRIYEIILKKTLQMIKQSNFKFLIEQAYPLEQFEARNPELYSEIKAAIASRKIEIVDGLYLMPDLMLPGGETLVREILSGKLYFREKFGVDVTVACVSDSFGLNAQMPQIYKKSGYKWLAFRRGLPKLIGYRVSEFIWEGLDGSQIVSHWMPLGYRAGLEINKWDDHYRKLSSLATTRHIFMPCGSGGVPPQEDIPEKVNQWNSSHDDSRMIISTPSEFFKNFESEKKRLTTFCGELYSADLENIFPDVVSSRISLKRAIKKCENSLLLAEKLASIALVLGKDYPVEEMNEMWKKMLFLANHDIMPSCGIDEIYDEAWNYIEEINVKTKALRDDSLTHIVRSSNKINSHNILVFNPYNWEVKDWVEVEIVPGDSHGKEFSGIALNGEEIKSQIVDISQRKDGIIEKIRIGFMADVPPMGFRVYQLCKRQKPIKSDIEVRGNKIANNYFRLHVDEKSGIIRIYDKEGFKLMEGNELVIDEEMGDLYFHNNYLDRHIASESGSGMRFGAFKPEDFKVEYGPLKTVITLKTNFYCLRWPYYLTEKFGPMLYRHKTVEVHKKIIVYNEIPRIDFDTTINLQQSHVRIRLKFDTCMVAPAYSRQTQYGVITLPKTKTLEQGIFIPAPFWVSSEERGRGIAFLTPGVPVNEIKAGEIYYTLIRSVSVLSADGISGPLIPTPGAMELGEHHYTYSAYCYNGTWKQMGLHRRAYEFGQPLLAIPLNYEPVDKESQYFRLDPDNVVISALKKAERDDALIVRFFETKGEKCEAILRLPEQIKRVNLVNLLEDEVAELTINGREVKISVNPFEIISLKLSIELLH